MLTEVFFKGAYALTPAVHIYNCYLIVILFVVQTTRRVCSHAINYAVIGSLFQDEKSEILYTIGFMEAVRIMLFIYFSHFFLSFLPSGVIKGSLCTSL